MKYEEIRYKQIDDFADEVFVFYIYIEYYCA